MEKYISVEKLRKVNADLELLTDREVKMLIALCGESETVTESNDASFNIVEALAKVSSQVKATDDLAFIAGFVINSINRRQEAEKVLEKYMKGDDIEKMKIEMAIRAYLN